jgi:pimeloyl-ACP methyl ester carboxylesterase
MASRVDEPMKDAVLRLYRSALTVGAEWQPGLSAVSAPCVVFWGARDPACQIEFGRRLGDSLHSSEVVEMDCNHWTVLQRPAEVAEILEKHWSAHAAD